VCLVCDQGRAEEEDEDEEGGDRKGDGQDEGEESGLDDWLVTARTSFLEGYAYDCLSSKVLAGPGRLLLPFVLWRWRSLASRREAQETIQNLKNDNDRRSF
jgi:hypothetical protein